MCPLSLGPPFHSAPSRPSKVLVENPAELPVLYSSLPLATYCTRDSVNVKMLLSRFRPPSPHPLCSHVHSLYLCFRIGFIHTIFSRFHIHGFIYSICFSLSDLLHAIGQTLGPSMSVQITLFHSFYWLSNIPLYICTTSLYIHLSSDTYIVPMS